MSNSRRMRSVGVNVKPEHHVRPSQWSMQYPMVFRAKEGSEKTALKDMAGYLEKRGVEPRMLAVGQSAEQVLYAVVSKDRSKQHKKDSHYTIVSRKASRLHLANVQWMPQEDLEKKSLLRQSTTKTTIASMIQGAIDEKNNQYRFYIIRYGNYVLYVGKGNNPVERVCGRLNPHSRYKDAFGKFMRQYVYDALSWTVELLTLPDCENLAVEVFLHSNHDAEAIRSEVIKTYRSNTKLAMEVAEKALIWRFQPCINDEYNPFPTPLPAEYADYIASQCLKSI